MALIFYGTIIGIFSALACWVAGDITPGQAFLIYWLVGSSVPLLYATVAPSRSDAD